MSKERLSALENLILSLTTSEKRYFKLMVNRNRASESSLFYKIFKFIEREGYWNERKAMKSIPNLKKSQISNLKKETYNHILDALRLFYKKNSIELTLRADIDNGKMLYNKALYNDSLKILDKAKKRALHFQLFSIALEIIEFEKYIESQHITNAKAYRAKELIRESRSIKKVVDSINIYMNLSLSLYDLYLKQGFAKNEDKFQYIKRYFARKCPAKNDLNTMTFFEQLYFFQSNAWYHYMLQNFSAYQENVQNWVDVFHRNTHMIALRPTLYLKGLHNLLTAQFNTKKHTPYIETLEALKNVKSNFHIRMDQNLKNLQALYVYLHQMDLYFWEGNFAEGVQFIQKLESIIDQNSHNWDIYRVMNFHYKMASMYFGNGDYSNTIEHLNKIMDHKNFPIHSEIHTYALILSTMSHFELGNTFYIEYLIKSVFRHLKLKENLQKVEKAILIFLKKLPDLTRENYLPSFIDFKEKLVLLKTDIFESRAFLYLDIISWLESHIEHKPVAEIIRRKFELGSDKE